jgi:hypothetical protein
VIKTDTPAKHKVPIMEPERKWVGGGAHAQTRIKTKQFMFRVQQQVEEYDKPSRHPHTLSAQNHLFILEWPMEKASVQSFTAGYCYVHSLHLLQVSAVFKASISLVL